MSHLFPCCPLGNHGFPFVNQVADLIKAFDDRVKEMCELRVQVQMFIASQVWYSSVYKGMDLSFNSVDER